MFVTQWLFEFLLKSITATCLHDWIIRVFFSFSAMQILGMTHHGHFFFMLRHMPKLNDTELWCVFGNSCIMHKCMHLLKWIFYSCVYERLNWCTGTLPFFSFSFLQRHPGELVLALLLFAFLILIQHLEINTFNEFIIDHFYVLLAS